MLSRLKAGLQRGTAQQKPRVRRMLKCTFPSRRKASPNRPSVGWSPACRQRPRRRLRH
jgi:hypothetical protein